jgi:hypothetical protein
LGLERVMDRVAPVAMGYAGCRACRQDPW